MKTSVLLRIKKPSTEFEHLSAFVSDIKIPSIIIIRSVLSITSKKHVLTILRNGEIKERFTEDARLLEHCALFSEAFKYQASLAGQSMYTTRTSGDSSSSVSLPQAGHVDPSPTPMVTPVSPVAALAASAATITSTDSSRSTATASQPAQARPGAVPTPTTSARQTNTRSTSPPAPQTSRGEPAVQSSLNPETSTSRSHASVDWAEQQRERNLEARRERDRILKQIQADKLARRLKATERRNLLSGNHISPTSSSITKTPSSTVSSDSARIQIRLISGRTIRRIFGASATPAADLRPFVDSELANDAEGCRVPAYRLKRTGIPPEPTREIELSEEHQSLAELGLTPSATLVVTPIHGATEAYGGGHGWSLLSLPVTIGSRAAGMIYGAVEAVGSAVSSTLGLGRTTVTSEQRNVEDSSSAAGRSARIRTIAELRAENEREDVKFYNGNQSNIQPHDKDDK